MDIFIKSFNRPYYLERCIISIIKNLNGIYTIIILDDGTSEECLNKLKDKYPELIISKSTEAVSKSALIKNHILHDQPIQITTIPITLWKNAIKESTSDYFILLEDDMWLTSPIKVEELKFVMSTNSFMMIKLFSFDFSKPVDWEKNLKVNDSIDEIITKFQGNSFNKNLFIFLLQNRFYCASILFKLRMYDYKWHLPIYSLYSVAGAVFNKEYWLYLWDTDFGKVNENTQLLNALKWLKKHPNSKFGKINNSVQTSFISSATNMFKGVNLDIYAFNNCINDYWYQDKLDCMQNYPNDFEVDYMAEFLDLSKDKRCLKEEWFKWIDNFKNQYRAYGFSIK